MRFIGSLVLTFWFLHLITLDRVTSQSDGQTATNESILQNDWSYCYEFTWLGPQYDNISNYNGSCEDYLDDTRAGNDIPCSPPLVITYDGSPPDLDYLWKNHKTSVLCKRTSSQVCARYTFLYNGEVQNSTYMCTKVQAMGEGPVTGPGCYTDTHDGFDVELCVCESNPGIYKPCNGDYE